MSASLPSAPAAATSESASTIQSYLTMLGNGAYLALASGFLMTDVLALRALLSAGYTGLVAYHSLQARPLWIPLRWSCVFVAVNVFYCVSLAMDRWPGELTAEEARLHAENFPQLSRGQLKQLLALGDRTNLPRGTEVTREGERCEHLIFIVGGRCKLYLHGTFAADIEAGGFINDVAFQQGIEAGAYGTVVVSSAEGCRAVTWRQEELVDFLKYRPEMHRNLNHVLASTLVKGLLAQREAAQARATSWAAHKDEGAEGLRREGSGQKRRRRRLSMTSSEMHLQEEPLVPQPPTKSAVSPETS